MIRSALAGLALAFVATVTLAACPQFYAGGIAPTVGYPVIEVCHTSYAIGFNPDWETPAYVVEHLTREQAEAGIATPRKAGGDFHTEPGLPIALRIKKSDYTNSGFDRGHMAPAGDFGADKAESFSMANMVPQVHVLNSGVWAGIEDAVRKLAIADGEIYVVTGPVTPAAHASIDNGRIAVPSHTWKAVYDPVKSGAAGYLCGNTVETICTREPLEDLAKQVGFNPLPGIPPGSVLDLPEPSKGQLAD